MKFMTPVCSYINRRGQVVRVGVGTPAQTQLSSPDTQECHDLLLTNIVGFIHHLPPPLMDAFRATLEEVTEATALL